MDTKPKIRLYKDMTPEEKEKHDSYMAMLSPHTIFREEHRAMLEQEGEDPSIADTCHDEFMEDPG